MNNKIPIFPLNIVIFPDSSYPLHIFEERYKRMLKRSLENNEEFGIVSKIDLEISHIGCMAKISEIVKTYENGSTDIIIKGGARFNIISQNFHPDGYLEAEVTPFEDLGEEEVDTVLVNKIMVRFHMVLEKAQVELSKNYWRKLKSANFKSYKFAEKAGMNLKQQQDLLCLQSEKERLRFVLNHFERIEKLIDKNQLISEIIAGDGYINLN